jgi:hypothetical protein
VQGDDFLDEADLFKAVADSGARALLIGRRALVALGLPVSTYDFDFWLHIEDIDLFNQALEVHEHFANMTPEVARTRGRYTIENGEHIDVLVSRTRRTPDGFLLEFEDAWERRQQIPFGDTRIAIPSIRDLITTKRWASRAKDIADIQMLEALERSR